MLAQNFKTAEELGLVPEALPALIKVLRMLEQGELVWTSYHKPVKNGFNMGLEWDLGECGTVGCIVGWAHHLEPAIRNEPLLAACRTNQQREALTKLYHPRSSGLRTVEEAAHALRTYLVTGTPEWA